jgi:ribosome-binding factor A
MASPYRINRVRELLLREFSAIITRLKDPRIGHVTVVDTEVSQDMRYATIFVSLMGSQIEQQEAKEALQSARGFIRREVAHRVPFRYTPEIRILYDDTAERAAHLTALINSLDETGDGGA